jgi:starch-binding outer membrane protein, SusD/RagB family
LSLQYLNDLQSKRITNFKGSALTGAKLLSEIKNERVRELIGEGYRFLDLKRWKDNMVRQTPQDKGVVSSKGLNLTINASDYRFLWPIPQAEIDANPQIKGQQNEGY